MIYSDFRNFQQTVKYVDKQQNDVINFYGYQIRKKECKNPELWQKIESQFQELEKQMNEYIDQLRAAIIEDSISQPNQSKQLKDLHFLNNQSQNLLSIIAKYEILEKIVFQDSSEFKLYKNHPHQSYIVPVDTYSKNNVDYVKDCSKLQFIIDKLSLKFNLASCYSRIPSRIEFDEMTGQGVIQGSNFYQKSAGVFQDILDEINQIKIINDLYQNQEHVNIWKKFERLGDSDLQKYTLKMLKNVMHAQSLYLQYNCMQKKIIQFEMSDNNDAAQISSALSCQIFHLFKQAYDQALKGNNKHVLSYKPQGRNVEQVIHIYFNFKRFEILNLQTISNNLFQKNNFEGSYAVAMLCYNLIKNIEQSDPVYKKFIDQEAPNESEDIKKKHKHRQQIMLQIIQEVQNKRPEIHRQDELKRNELSAKEVDNINYDRWVNSIQPLEVVQILPPNYLYQFDIIDNIFLFHRYILQYQLQGMHKEEIIYLIDKAQKFASSEIIKEGLKFYDLERQLFNEQYSDILYKYKENFNQLQGKIDINNFDYFGIVFGQDSQFLQQILDPSFNRQQKRYNEIQQLLQTKLNNNQLKDQNLTVILSEQKKALTEESYICMEIVKLVQQSSQDQQTKEYWIQKVILPLNQKIIQQIQELKNFSFELAQTQQIAEGINIKLESQNNDFKKLCDKINRNQEKTRTIKQGSVNQLSHILDQKFLILNQKREEDHLTILQLQEKMRVFLIEEIILFPSLQDVISEDAFAQFEYYSKQCDSFNDLNTENGIDLKTLIELVADQQQHIQRRKLQEKSIQDFIQGCQELKQALLQQSQNFVTLTENLNALYLNQCKAETNWYPQFMSKIKQWIYNESSGAKNQRAIRDFHFQQYIEELKNGQNDQAKQAQIQDLKNKIDEANRQWEIICNKPHLQIL